MDSNAISWDIPAQRTRKVEKYDFPVLTMSAIELKGSNRKFSLNKSAMETLGLVGGESEVNIGFKGNQVFITKGAKFRVGKNCSFSDKRVFEYLVKLCSLNTTVENEFRIKSIVGESFFELTPFYGLLEPVEKIEVMQLGGAVLEQEDFTTNISNDDLESTEEVVEEEAVIPAILRESAGVLKSSDNITNLDEIITEETPETSNDTDFDTVDESIDFSDVADMGVTNSTDSDWE